MTNIEFNQIVMDQALAYAKEYTKVLQQLTYLEGATIHPSEVQKKISIEQDYIATISFVGMVTGEFILSFDEQTAKNIFGKEASSEDIRDFLSESLNMVAGSRIGDLSAIFQKLTIMPPRVISGRVRYPGIKSVPIEIKTHKGNFWTYFYIDKMKLEIAESYSDMITQWKRVNGELFDANDKLKQQQAQLVHSEKMSSLGIMAAGVAHEINNPLAFVTSNAEILDTYVDAMRTLIIGYDELLKLMSQGKTDSYKTELDRITELKKKEDIEFVLEDTRNLLAESKFGLERIRSIVGGLRRFSRLDEGEWKKVQLNEELENTLMLLHNELKHKCNVETSFKATQIVNCLPGELGQVFVNLIMNSAHAVATGTGLITVSTRDDGDQVLISVKDNGVGISEENLNKLFSPFFTTKPVGEGTGLGLAISHGIVQKHGGNITVQSKLGEGAEFTISLPVSGKKAQAA